MSSVIWHKILGLSADLFRRDYDHTPFYGTPVVSASGSFNNGLSSTASPEREPTPGYTKTSSLSNAMNSSIGILSMLVQTHSVCSPMQGGGKRGSAGVADSLNGIV